MLLRRIVDKTAILQVLKYSKITGILDIIILGDVITCKTPENITFINHKWTESLRIKKLQLNSDNKINEIIKQMNKHNYN